MPELRSPLTAQIVEWRVRPGDTVHTGDLLLVLEAMKMEHEVRAAVSGVVRELFYAAGEPVNEGDVLATTDAAAPAPESATQAAARPAAPDGIRPDLQRVMDRHAFTQDAARADAVAKRHALGLRTARENITDLCDPGSFSEYGALAVAAQATRRSADDLMRNTPADGMVTGIGSINGALFGPERSRAVVMAYDATVLAGTQGMRNHQKTDRLLGMAGAQPLPVVLLGRRRRWPAWRHRHAHRGGPACSTFASFARLNGQVPVVGMPAGRCFAGNAALLGCCDVIIATESSNIGMGGPAMVEGGGLGVFRPEEIGPVAVQHGNGVIDVLVDDEAAKPSPRRQVPGLGFRAGVIPGVHTRPTRRRCARWCPRTACACTTPRRHGRHVDAGSLLELRAALALASTPRWRASRAARWVCWPTTRPTWAAPSTPTPPTRPRASCSYATPTACHWSAWWTRPASWWARPTKSQAQVRHAAAHARTAAQRRPRRPARILGGLHRPRAQPHVAEASRA
jgi:acetyl-CoA carboxylase beta subunit